MLCGYTVIHKMKAEHCKHVCVLCTLFNGQLRCKKPVKVKVVVVMRCNDVDGERCCDDGNNEGKIQTLLSLITKSTL